MLFENKIKFAKEIIVESMKIAKKPFLSMSWGKDSAFLLFLFKEMNIDIDVIFLNSNYCCPDTYEYRDRIIKEWNIQKYIELKQEIDYMDLCKEFGLPSERTKQEEKKVRQKIKIDTLNDYAINNNYDLCFWGIRMDESKGRKYFVLRYGDITTNQQVNKSSPIARIKLNELFYFYDYYNIPLNPIYTKTKFLKREQIRNSGWISILGAENGKVKWLQYYYPEQFQKLVKEFPEVRKYV